MKTLLALAATPAEQSFFEQIAELAVGSFSLTIFPAVSELDLSPYSGQVVLSAQPLAGLPLARLTTSKHQEGYLLPSLDVANFDGTTIFRLASYLSQLTVDFLDRLPLEVAVTDQNNQLIYHNNKPKDPFLFDEIERTPVEDWIIQQVETAPNHVAHLLLPSTSLEQILIQSYQGLYQDGQLTGIIRQVQDIRPLLASYLQETGQALVGWSDTISGASIKNSLFEDEEF